MNFYKTLGKLVCYGSFLASVKRSLVFQKMFTTYEEKKSILGQKCLLAPRSLKRESGLWFFEGTLSSPAFSKVSLNEQNWITQPSIPRLFHSIFLGTTESQAIFSQAVFYFQTTTSQKTFVRKKNLSLRARACAHTHGRERSFPSHIVKQPSTCNSRHFSCFQSWKNKEKFRVQGFKNKPTLWQTDQNATSCYYVKQGLQKQRTFSTDLTGRKVVD